MNPNTALRPSSLADYVGQPALVARLRILIDAAKSRREPVGHILLHGPPGLGKTTLAYIVAAEMGVNAHVAMGPTLEKPQDIVTLLTRLGEGDILFIDEIHRVTGAMGECLYPAMEDREITLSLDPRGLARPVTIPLPPFTLIGATTQPGLLDGPMRDRFGTGLAMEFYNPSDLAKILTVNARKLGVEFDAPAISLLASRSRGTPRIANHLLRFSRDYAAVKFGGRLSVPVVDAALMMQGIDAAGLDTQDRNYIRVLNNIYNGGPAGADAIAATIGVKSDTVASVIEPYLLLNQYVIRSRRGRILTDKGKRHLAADFSSVYKESHNVGPVTMATP